MVFVFLFIVQYQMYIRLLAASHRLLDRQVLHHFSVELKILSRVTQLAHRLNHKPSAQLSSNYRQRCLVEDKMKMAADLVSYKNLGEYTFNSQFFNEYEFIYHISIYSIYSVCHSKSFYVLRKARVP